MKKVFLICISLVIISFLFFNFNNGEKKSEKIDDIIHQREFNSYFRSYTLTTPDSIHFVENMSIIHRKYGKDMIKKFIKMFTGNQIHYFILREA